MAVHCGNQAASGRPSVCVCVVGVGGVWCGDRPGNGPCITDITCMGNTCVYVSSEVKEREDGSLRRRRPALPVMSHFRDAAIL